MLRRFLCYADKVFKLRTLFEQVRDRRVHPHYPSETLAGLCFILFACRLRSFNQLDDYREQGSCSKWIGTDIPSTDELGYGSECFELDSLREILAAIYTRLMRNKVLLPFRGWRVAAIDGHEINCSYKRCCAECLQRKIECKGQQRTQYYHRVVVLQLISGRFQFLLDAELVQPGEEEVGAAKRLMERVLKRFPRCFDLLTGDALYAQAPVLNLLARYGKKALMVLKDERRDLWVDAQALFETLRPRRRQEGKTCYELWDLEGLTSWTSVEAPVRVIRSLETTSVRERIGGNWTDSTRTHDWVWVSTFTLGELPTDSAVSFGHARWKIENEGFNELGNYWYADHYFHHHPTTILALWLFLFMAHALFHCFIQRNIKKAARDRHSVIYWADQMKACFCLDGWWPVPT